MKLSYATLWLLALIVICMPATAASEFQLWTESGVRYKLDKQFRIKFDQHFRFDENLSATDSIMPEIAISYRPAKFIRFEAGYRYIAEPIESKEGAYWESWQRFFADIRLRYRLKPITFRYRLRFQEEFGWPWRNHGELASKHTIRNKLGVEVKLAYGLAPFTSLELFNRLSDPDGPWHKWRLTTGLDFETGSHRFTLFYRLEDLLADADDPTRHILGIGYHFLF